MILTLTFLVVAVFSGSTNVQPAANLQTTVNPQTTLKVQQTAPAWVLQGSNFCLQAC